MMGERKIFMKIIDDYLTESECKFICLNTINSVHFPLHLMQSVSGNDNHDGIFFTHKFVENNQPNSNCLGMIVPLLEKLIPNYIFRAQLNLFPGTFLRRSHSWHIDQGMGDKGLIYYLNTNNGRTDLKGKAKVKSVRNRALFFDPSKLHRSTTCTDQEFRANIIINYD